jgi:hypothetical protein
LRHRRGDVEPFRGGRVIVIARNRCIATDSLSNDADANSDANFNRDANVVANSGGIADANLVADAITRTSGLDGAGDIARAA